MTLQYVMISEVSNLAVIPFSVVARWPSVLTESFLCIIIPESKYASFQIDTIVFEHQASVEMQEMALTVKFWG